MCFGSCAGFAVAELFNIDCLLSLPGLILTDFDAHHVGAVFGCLRWAIQDKRVVRDYFNIRLKLGILKC